MAQLRRDSDCCLMVTGANSGFINQLPPRAYARVGVGVNPPPLELEILQKLCYLTPSLHWRYKLLLYKSTPFAGDKNSISYFVNQLPMLEVQTVAF